MKNILCAIAVLVNVITAFSIPSIISFDHIDAESQPVPLLKREIVRQAYILGRSAKREIICHDEVIGDSLSTNTTHLLKTITKPTTSGGISISVSNQTSTVWQAQFEQADYEELLAATIQRTANDLNIKLPVLSESDTTEFLDFAQLDSGSITDLFDLLRKAHSIHKERASLRTYGALIRGYANLGARSEHLWSPCYKAFQARSLIYSEYLVESAPNNARSHFLRAYAFGLCGLHANALADIDAGKELSQKNPPDWLLPLENMLEFRTDELVKLANEDSPLHSTASLMAMQTLEFTPFGSRVFDTHEKIHKTLPVDLRTLAQINAYGGVGSRHSSTMAGFGQMAVWVTQELPRHQLLPDNIRTAYSNSVASAMNAKGVGIWPTGGCGSSVGDFPELDYVRQLNQILTKETQRGKDVGTPSLSAFGNLLRENMFYVAMWRQYFMDEIWSVDIDEYTETVLPYVEGHPLENLLKAISEQRHGKHGNRNELLKSVDVSGLPASAHRFYTNMCKEYAPYGKYKGKELWLIYPKLLDKTHVDLQRRYSVASNIEKLGKEERLPFADAILQASPHSPYGLKTVLEIADNWEERIEGLPSKDVLLPEISRAIASRYRISKQYEKAIPYYEVTLEKIPNQSSVYKYLAKCYLGMGDEEKWLEVLKSSLNIEVTGLQHARTRIDIASYYLKKRDFEQATYYAEAAADCYSSWSLTFAAAVAAIRGDQERARELFQANDERYSTFPMNTYYVAQIYGFSENDPWFIKTKKRAMKSLGKPGPTLINQYLAAMYHWRGQKPENAEGMINKIFKRKKDAWYGIPVALLQLEQNKIQAMKRTLNATINKSPRNENKYNRKTMKELAALIRRELDFPSKPEALMNKLIELQESRNMSREDFGFLAGKYMAIRGYEAEAVQLFYKGVAPGLTAWNGPLPYLELMDRGLDPYAVYRDEVPAYTPTK